MRLNKLIALATGTGRRPADKAIATGRVSVNGAPAQLGQEVAETDTILFDGKALAWPTATRVTIMLNKPVGYVVSRDGQGSKTIYDLLSAEYHSLKPVGRLDKDSSGLLLLTNDGQLANELTHPSRQKVKIYEVGLNKSLEPLHRQIITDHGVLLDDGPSKFQLERQRDGDDRQWQVTMHEGRNRQIRRTFEALGYHVASLHRTHFGPYQLGDLRPGALRPVVKA
jgi:23S rRNA pseudouridine2605 synthase